ncbi:hypothetical protein [Methylobacterium aquaticum]|uniref:Uncharacterized protein n=1 Tax=Methylobacterium aquaticum TaxID=270351 RepID=A0A0C6F4M6_9HYPH|nr:hypothetical protein [Methylobacterium aquaticum]BAQ47671.1 hypothetical protein Maq22A_c23620 [Methylobacterium aquaticum]
MTQPKTHVLKRALQRRERDELHAAFALGVANGATNLFHVTTVDAWYRPIPDTGLDLVVRAATSDCAFTAWQRHAEDLGAEGKHLVEVTFTPLAVRGEPQPERSVIQRIDLDMQCLLDELGDLYDEEVTLGTVIPAYSEEPPPWSSPTSPPATATRLPRRSSMPFAMSSTSRRSSAA